MNCVTWKSPTTRLVDGIGIDSDGFERIIFECSGGFISEKPEHALEDTIKQTQSCVSVLKSDAFHHLDASFETFQKRRILGIHIIKSKMTLIETRINQNKRWEILELCSASIPLTWRNRFDWLKVYELVTTMLVSII